MTPDSDVLPPRVLRSSRLRSTALVVGFVFATVCGVLMVDAHADYGWLTLGFGLLGLSVFLFTFFHPNRLELSSAGLTTVTLGRRWSAEWSQCGEFHTWKDHANLGSPWMVVFDCRAPGVSGHLLELAAVALTGVNASLPETYGMSASDLAALLNRYRLAAAELYETF